MVAKGDNSGISSNQIQNRIEEAADVKRKVSDAAPSSPKRRKVLKTRIDERGREVTEVVWKGDALEGKDNINAKMKDTMMKASNSAVTTNNSSMDKGLNSQGDDEFAFFQYLPDELVIEIFTKLSNSNAPNDTLDDLKLLGQCSTVCKQFNSLVCLVRTLNIKHPCCQTLYDYCPKILKKFKHIRSLQVKHWSCAETRVHYNRQKCPTVFFDAAYRPQSYSLVVISYKKISYYSDLLVRDSLMLSDAGMEYDNDYLYTRTKEHAFDLMRLHHMLVSSIKDHNYLQMVVVTDFMNRGTFTLEEEMLAELRNCSSINLEQVQGLARSGFFSNLDVPLENNWYGVVLYHVCFHIIEWSEMSADDPIYKADADADGGIPTGLPFKGSLGALLKTYLGILLKNPDDLWVNDSKIVRGLLSEIKSKGNLL